MVGAPGSLGYSTGDGSQMEPSLPPDAELGPNVGSAISLHDSPAVDAVEVVKELPRHRQVVPGR